MSVSKVIHKFCTFGCSTNQDFEALSKKCVYGKILNKRQLLCQALAVEIQPVVTQNSVFLKIESSLEMANFDGFGQSELHVEQQNRKFIWLSFFCSEKHQMRSC